MNFLAHAHLSFNHPEILVGNMISDFVKGSRKFDFSEGIQQGITLHRQIDTFTDEHAATKEAIAFLKPAVGMYAGAFVDVAYDHFLANDSNEFSDTSLQTMATNTYDVLDSFQTILPEKFQYMLPYMRSQNWLYNYKTISGTQSSFGGVVRRAKYLDSHEKVFELFLNRYEEIQECYTVFFPAVKSFALHQIEQLKKI